MNISSSPTPRKTLVYQYENRDQRLEIQSVLRNFSYYNSDVTCFTIFSSPSEGKARMELRELDAASKADKVQKAVTPLNAALRYIENSLSHYGIQKVDDNPSGIAISRAGSPKADNSKNDKPQ